eukprot:TRINITY_DN35979_c0_g1_i1.p1 TRINITY_DN35979_c0_g1~~TRINITY_DN35979_c0_g1_i1.p1  ORF type:complete len:266 (-),score=73.23 TRINITY_DN35979_c0_g1_i1:226-1023(-)
MMCAPCCDNTKEEMELVEAASILQGAVDSKEIQVVLEQPDGAAACETEPQAEDAAKEVVPEPVTEPAAEPAPPPPTTFDAKLQVGEGIKYGFRLNTLSEQHCIVSEVLSEGAVCSWNANCKPQEEIKMSDCIMKVDGVDGDSAKIGETLKNASGIVTLTLKRPKEVEIEVSATQEMLGMKLKREDYTADGVKATSLGLLVTEVAEASTFGVFNAANPDKAIKTGDRIIAVHNGTDFVTGPEEVKAELSAAKSRGCIRLKFTTWQY